MGAAQPVSMRSTSSAGKAGNNEQCCHYLTSWGREQWGWIDRRNSLSLLRMWQLLGDHMPRARKRHHQTRVAQYQARLHLLFCPQRFRGCWDLTSDKKTRSVTSQRTLDWRTKEELSGQTITTSYSGRQRNVERHALLAAPACTPHRELLCTSPRDFALQGAKVYPDN
ncbi:leucine-rich single-pass membrane protein 2 [Platysternon megacephalum]|uniref:Leucine-rich single-pass membrane protein 2 n=1 Tax=Platysternon megacephalum TaxID=55544 RepID=A0A4D9DTC8_9SAUR|nr:leucine-rich single-pass membrane protein 2 [Platysternon megacephalum]